MERENNSFWEIAELIEKEVNDQISKLKIKQLKETVPDMADYVDQSWRVG